MVKHLDKHSHERRQERYQILVFDRYGCHVLVEFQEYCKSNDIIALSISPHSFHLTQPLGFGCYSVLK